jgi:hypothetical protein
LASSFCFFLAALPHPASFSIPELDSTSSSVTAVKSVMVVVVVIAVVAAATAL